MITKTVCSECGQPVRFIKRRGQKALIVESRPVWFIPATAGETFVTDDGGMATGRRAEDGRRGWKLHKCRTHRKGCL